MTAPGTTSLAVSGPWVRLATGLAVALLAGDLAVAQTAPPSPPVRLSVEARATRASIDVTASVASIGADAVTVGVVPREIPVEISLIDDTGVDVYACHYADRSKDGHGPVARKASTPVPITVTPQSPRRYSWRVAEVCGEKGDRVPLQAGRYRLRARLAVVPAGTGARAALVESDEISVDVAR